MERIQFLILGINAVTGKTAAQSVGTIVHGLHGIGNRPAGHSVALTGNDGSDGASGGDSYLAFQFHISTLPFGKIE